MMEYNNISKTDIEYFLLNREYSELSKEELQLVSEHVSSEKEYNEMRAVLLGMGKYFDESLDISPDPKVKAELLKEFDRQRPGGAYWLNGIVISLFPKEKKVFQKPGVQLIGLAASFLLVFTVFNSLDNTVTGDQLAVNDSTVVEQELVPETDVTDIVEEKSVDKLNNDQGVVSEGEKLEEMPAEITVDGEEKVAYYSYEEIVSKTESVSVLDEVAEFETEEETVAEEDEWNLISANEAPVTGMDMEDVDLAFGEISEQADMDSRFEATVNTIPSVASSDMETLADGSGIEKGKDKDKKLSNRSVLAKESKKDEVTDLPKMSRSLAEDAELLGVLYTAM